MEKLTGKGFPSSYLVGQVGQWYEDLDTGDIYECRVASKHSTIAGFPDGGYVWERRAKGEDVRELYGAGGNQEITPSSISWNDLEDKPFDESIVRDIVIISPKTFTHTDNPLGWSVRYAPECDLPEEGQSVEVIFDGRPYHCVVHNYTGSAANRMTYIGNPYIFLNGAFEDNGIPFFIRLSYIENSGTVQTYNDIYVQDKEAEHTIEAFIGAYELKSIDTKYVVNFPDLKPGQALIAKSINKDGTPKEFAGADIFSGSWNNLSDRPFGETVTISTKYIEYQETSAEDNNITVSGSFSMGLPTGYNLVIFDGQEYIAQTIYKVPPTQNPEVIVGNASLITEPYNGVPYENNGLPFAIYYDYRTRKTVLLTQDNEISHTIEAYIATYELNELDEKFIPDTIARTEDIPKASSIPDAAGETVTASEFNALLAALRSAGLMET